MTVEIDADGEATLRVGDAPLDPEKVYRVATNSFLARAGDGFGTFSAGRNRRSPGVLFRDALAADLRKRSPLTPPAKARFSLLVADR